MAVIKQEMSDRYALYNGDCVEVMKSLPDEKIHASIYSPPFGGLYHYSSCERDLSNNDDYEGFFEHYTYVVEELYRITKSGRFTAVHCMDIPKGNSGKGDGYIDFPGDIIRMHEKIGFEFYARHHIWKEPLWVRNRTMAKNLSHITTVKDSLNAGVAGGDYLLIFRKKGESEVAVTNPTGYSYYAGECPIPEDLKRFTGWTGDQKLNKQSHWIWRRYASSVWDDIDMARVLPFRDSKDPEDEKHVHPLQLDVIERFVQLRTNPNEIVFTPFMGVGSEVFGSVKMGRFGIGAELKESYFRQACKNLEIGSEEVESDRAQQELSFGLDIS